MKCTMSHIEDDAPITFQKCRQFNSGVRSHTYNVHTIKTSLLVGGGMPNLCTQP